MSRNAIFVRKIGYITAIALLLLPLAALSQPAAVGPNRAAVGSPGGKLAQLRKEYNLAQADLGEIDPASVTMKLSTFGLQGVAANVLWVWANHYKKVEDWDKLELTVNQIIRLQPNFLEVWDFQAHNLSYNVSTEFDDYRMRYQWVKKGIDFLILGTHYNRQEPGLLNQLGWFTGQKVGRSDEQKQFRRMFRTDEDFHALFRRNGVEVDQEEALGPDAKPDNWLVARLWFNRAIDAHVISHKPIRGKSPLLFYSSPPMSQINGSAAMQKDGYFGQRLQIAWQRAADEWRAYGDRELPASEGFTIQLNDLEEIRERLKNLRDELDVLAPGVREAIRQEKLAKLTPEKRALLEKPQDKLAADEYQPYFTAQNEVFVTDQDVLARAPRENRPKVRAIVEQVEMEEARSASISRNRGIVNFEYWRTRCDAERTPLAQRARKNVHDADRLFASGEKFAEARKLYEAGWTDWAELFKNHAALIENAETQDLVESIQNYRDLLNQLDEKFPEDFILTSVLERHEPGRRLLEQVRLIKSASGGAAAPRKATPADIKPLEVNPIEGKPPETSESKAPGKTPSGEKKSDPAKTP